MSANRMVLDNQEAYLTGTEMELMERLLPLSDCRVLELSCGSARITRRLARAHPDCHFIATEVDSVQHEKKIWAIQRAISAFAWKGRNRSVNPIRVWMLC
ncbi:MAG: class I SAM-dependent methyltransferase [Candidatus Thiodiazotropha endolucinida]